LLAHRAYRRTRTIAAEQVEGGLARRYPFIALPS
jgi:hypothetical protein